MISDYKKIYQEMAALIGEQRNLSAILRAVWRADGQSGYG